MSFLPVGQTKAFTKGQISDHPNWGSKGNSWRLLFNTKSSLNCVSKKCLFFPPWFPIFHQSYWGTCLTTRAATAKTIAYLNKCRPSKQFFIFFSFLHVMKPIHLHVQIINNQQTAEFLKVNFFLQPKFHLGKCAHTKWHKTTKKLWNS